MSANKFQEENDKNMERMLRKYYTFVFFRNVRDAAMLTWAAERAEADAWIAAKKSFDKDIADAYNEGYEEGYDRAERRYVNEYTW